MNPQNIAAPKYNKRGQIRRKGKDRDGFLTAAADCQNRKYFANQRIAI